MLHPWTNNYTAISVKNPNFINDEACYYKIYADQEALGLNETYDFQIDANFTELNGVVAFLTNGTSIYTSGNDTEVDGTAFKKNYTFNASDYNNLWIHFMADPGYLQ